MKSYKTYIEKQEGIFNYILHFKNNGYLIAGLYKSKDGNISYTAYPYNNTRNIRGIDKATFKKLLDKHREYK